MRMEFVGSCWRIRYHEAGSSSSTRTIMIRSRSSPRDDSCPCRIPINFISYVNPSKGNWVSWSRINHAPSNWTSISSRRRGRSWGRITRSHNWIMKRMVSKSSRSKYNPNVKEWCSCSPAYPPWCTKLNGLWYCSRRGCWSSHYPRYRLTRLHIYPNSGWSEAS